MERAIRSGAVSKDEEGGFPRYFWIRDDSMLYRGRLINQTQGWYQAHPIEDWELPPGLESLLEEAKDRAD